MKKRYVLLALLLSPLCGIAQDWHAGAFLGISNYSGDLVQQRVDMGYTRPSLGLFIRRDINRYLTLRAAANFGIIEGADRTNTDPNLKNRNLSFRSPIWEGNLAAEFNFLDIMDKGFTPYVFAGVAVFSFYPTTKDSLGNTVKLRRLSTEGQGLPQYPDRQQYNLISMAIPFGAGIKVMLTDRWTLGAEIGLRKTFSDYLDDVSLTYVDKNTLLAERGQMSVDFAYRGNELPGHQPGGYYPVDGFPRGSDKHKDWYVFSGLTISYRFGNNSNLPFNRWGRQKVSNCPRF